MPVRMIQSPTSGWVDVRNPGTAIAQALARFERTQPDRLSTSLAEAMEHVQELVCPKLELEPVPLVV